MKYSVVKHATPYQLSNGFVADETVVVTFLNDENTQIDSRKFGFISRDNLIDLKEKHPDFQLRELYFYDFSIREYHDFFMWEEDKSLLDFYAEKCFFDGNSDFSKTEFGKSRFSLAYSFFGNGKVNFHESVFLSDSVHFNNIVFGVGEKDYSSVSFYGREINFFGTQFSDGKVSFRCCSINNGRLNFSGVSFGKGDVDFDFSIFSALGIDFSGVSFGDGEVSFRNVNFNGGNTVFFGTNFGEGKLSFSGSVFGDGNIDFSLSQYNNCIIHFKYVSFGYGRFSMDNMSLAEGYVLFKSNEFKGKVITFSESILNQIIFHSCLFKEHVNMSVKECSLLVLENCIIEKSFDLACSSNRLVQIKCFNILNTKNLGLIDIDWNMNNVKSMIYAQEKTTNYREKANQFRLLKENFRNIGHYDDEDYAYVEFKRCESISKLKNEDLINKNSSKFKHIKRYIIHPFKWFILDFIGNYATNPIRIIGAMFMTVIVFTILYAMPFVKLNGDKTLFHAGNNPAFQTLSKALYHSIATIFTIGYGDVNPGNFLAMLLSGFEGFIGLFLMSYFTVAFVRKILR